MNWFEQMCRNAGLMVHHIREPQTEAPQTQEVGRTSQETQVSPTVTLRRTTIDEVEVKQPAPARVDDAAGSSKPGSGS